MIFRALTADGDWKFGAGRSNYARGDAATFLNVATTLKTFLGECFYNPAVGQDWFSLINERNKDIVTLAIKAAISGCVGVTRVREIEYTYSASRSLVIKYYLDTLYTTNNLGTVTI